MFAHEFLGSFFSFGVFVIWLAVVVFVLSLAFRLVKAVERIADILERK